jgi:hypothetical protein
MYPWETFPECPGESWFRLLRSHRCVGFRKTIAGVPFFSKDGYAWSGTPITFDREVPETGLRDRMDARVFVGDMVLLPGRDGRAYRKVVVLSEEDTGHFCWFPETEELQPLEALMSGSERVVVSRVLGSVYEEPALGEKVDRALALFSPASDVSWLFVLLCLVCLAAGLAGSSWLQLRIVGELGPLVSVMGVCVGAFAFFGGIAHLYPGWLNRARLLKLAWRSSVGAAVHSVLVCGVLLWNGSMWGAAQAHPFLALGTSAVLSWLTSVCVVMMAGDVALWIWTDNIR